jgi:hypothetical protein
LGSELAAAGEIVVIGQALGPPASHDARGQGFVDDNHAQPPVRCSVVALAPAEHRVYDRVGVESGLERRRQEARSARCSPRSPVILGEGGVEQAADIVS